MVRHRLFARQKPRSGHSVSPCFVLKPQLPIIPTWQMEKSNRTGSTGSMARSEAVMSAAMRHPGSGSASNADTAPAESRACREARRAAPARCVSRRRGRPHPAAPSTAGRDSGACRRCPPQAAGKSSRHPAAAAIVRTRSAGRMPARARKTKSAPALCPVQTDRRPPQRTPQWTRRLEHLPQHPEQRDDVGSTNPAMYERRERRALNPRLERLDERRGRWPHQSEHRLDRLIHAGDPSEGERRGAEPGDLAVRGAT